MQHRTVDLDGPVHYADFGGAGRPIVLVHGLGGSHLNWLGVGHRLAAHGRVLALDLVGHGLTSSLGRSARVGSNRRLLGRFLDAVVDEPAVLIGNSMGGYLAIAEAALEPRKVHSLVLVNPAVPPVLRPAASATGDAAGPLLRAPGARWDPRVAALFAGMMLPFVGSALMLRRAALGPERAVRDLLALCCADPSRIERDLYEAHVALARERSHNSRINTHDFLTAQRSLMVRLFRRRRFYSMVASVRANALIVQGDRDRLVRIEAARALAAARPDWRLEVLDGIGHVPQIEAPERFLAAVEPWVTRGAGARAAT